MTAEVPEQDAKSTQLTITLPQGYEADYPLPQPHRQAKLQLGITLFRSILLIFLSATVTQLIVFAIIATKLPISTVHVLLPVTLGAIVCLGVICRLLYRYISGEFLIYACAIIAGVLLGL